MPTFDDLLYPDNPRRERRALEVSSDCTTITGLCIEYSATLKQSIESASSKIRDAMSKMGRPVPPLKEIKLHNELQYVIYALDAFSGVLVYSKVTSYLTQAAALYVARNAARQGSEFVGLLERLVPLSGRWKWAARGAGVAAAIAVDVVFSAISGAARRSELQSAISGGVPTRFTLKRIEMANRMASNRALIILGMVEEYIADGRNPDDILAMVERQVARFKTAVDAIKDKAVADELDLLDHTRSSWTNEDPAVSRSDTPTFTTMPVPSDRPILMAAAVHASASGAASPLQVAIKTADGRYLSVSRNRVQWIYAASRNFDEAVLFRATAPSDGCVQLQFCPKGEVWDRYLYPNNGPADDGSSNAIWANATEAGPSTHFAIEKADNDGHVRMRAANGKLLVPVESGEVKGHIEASGADSNPATLFRMLLVHELEPG